MPNGEDDFYHASEIESLQREIKKLTSQRNVLAFNSGKEVAKLEAELTQMRSDAALVVHALNCALQLTEVLIAFTPEGSVLHPGVATAKTALDMAMLQISRQRRTLEGK